MLCIKISFKNFSCEEESFQILISNLKFGLLNSSRNTVLFNYILIFDLQSKHQPVLKIKIQRLLNKVKVFKSKTQIRKATCKKRGKLPAFLKITYVRFLRSGFYIVSINKRNRIVNVFGTMNRN